MSLALSGDTIAYLMGLGLDAEQMKGLVDRLQRDALAVTPPTAINGVNEERERLRNESTYAERKRAKDRERRAAEREELRRLRDASPSTTPATTGEATATAGDKPRPGPLSLAPSPQTPQPHTHSPESVSSTREARTREEAGFAKFWATYPRKTAKADARKAFAKAWRKLPPMDEEAILIGGLERAKAAWSDAQFIPHAATWLNGERWQDEPAEIITLTPRKAHERNLSPDAKLAAKQANYERAWTGSERAFGRDGKP